MTDWVPIIVGFVIIAAAIIAVRRMPHSALAKELRRSYGVAPTGDRGFRTRRDHAKSAGVAALVTLGLGATFLFAGLMMQRYPNGSRANLIASTYMFMAFLLTGVAALVALRALWKAASWHIELPDTPEHRRGFADAIDHFLDGSTSPDERANYLDVRYLHPQIEAIRRSTLKLVSKHNGSLPDDFRRQIKELTASIRASAGP
jgi:hypothetical protein